MVTDEDAARDAAKMEAILADQRFRALGPQPQRPRGHYVHTLGDLTQVTEEELLNGRNFGETSPREVRDLLGIHGLRGRPKRRNRRAPPFAPASMSPQEQAVQTMPLSEISPFGFAMRNACRGWA